MSQAIAEPVLKGVTLKVTTDRATVQQVAMQDGASLMIGSGANCGIRLNSMRISSIHCLLQLTDGHLTLQDWCSMLGTFVNGKRVEDQCELRPGDVVKLGEFAIEVAALVDAGQKGAADKRPMATSPRSEPSSTSAATSEGREMAERPARPEMAPVTEPPSAPLPTSPPTAADPIAAAPKPVPSPPASPPSSSDSAALAEKITSSVPGKELPQKSPVPSVPVRPVVKLRDSSPGVTPVTDPWSDDTVALLQSELDLLQAELRERDQELCELRASLLEEGSVSKAGQLDEQQTEALVGRLEDLLDELARSDQRALALEDLLRAEQERTSAEQEERQQVEVWLEGIEQRLSDREAEWNAERTILQNRLEQLRADREQLDQQLQEQATSDQDRALATIVQDLRQQLEAQQSRLEAAEQGRAKAEQLLEAAQSRSVEESARESVEEAVREERLRLAQERATLSRDRADLARKLAELQEEHPGKRCDADERYIALRQTLKETREIQEPPVKKPTLGARLAELWRRLDGPTDTD